MGGCGDRFLCQNLKRLINECLLDIQDFVVIGFSIPKPMMWKAARSNLQHSLAIQINLAQDLITGVIHNLAQALLLGLLIEDLVKRLPFQPVGIMLLFFQSEPLAVSEQWSGKKGRQAVAQTPITLAHALILIFSDHSANV